MLAAIAGSMCAIGLLVLLRGAFPARPDLKTRLAQFNEHDFATDYSSDSLLQSLATTLLQTVKGTNTEQLMSDLSVTNTSFDEIAMKKLRAAGALSAFMVFAGFLFGFLNNGMTVIVVVLLGAVGGYFVPDGELKKEAAARRIEFSKALTAFITLLASSISGGGGINTAMTDAAAMGSGWVFEKLRDALGEAKLSGVSPWVMLDALGRQLQVMPLVELAGSLTLAGANGARVTETLQSRAESARDKELSEVRAEAERKSSSLGAPVGMMLLAWALFMAYPAVLNLMGAA